MSRTTILDRLPSLHRLRDAEGGGQLAALLEAIEAELDAVRADIETLGDAWFIETCPDWVVPYIGALVGARAADWSGFADGGRAFVANAISRARRKGTPGAIEALARDVTLWPTVAEEGFGRLVWAQPMCHVQNGRGGTPDLREALTLDLLPGPLAPIARTAEMRRAPPVRGRFNLPSVALHAHTLRAFPLRAAEARRAEGAPAGCFTIHPLGVAAPLFNRPLPEAAFAPAAERNLPLPIRPRALHAETEAHRAGSPPLRGWFSPDPVLALVADGEEISPARFRICSMGDPADPGSWTWRMPVTPGHVAIDPRLGRIAFRPQDAPQRLLVDHAHGLAAAIGGGAYDQRAVRARLLPERGTVFRVGRDLPADPPRSYASLASAVADWNAMPPGSIGTIEIADSGLYEENLTGAATIVVPQGSRLALVAAEGTRPAIIGDIAVRGSAGADQAPGEMLLLGCLVGGSLRVLPGHLGSLTVAHATVAPEGTALALEADSPPEANAALAVAIEAAILGAIAAAASVPSLSIRTSIVLGAISAPGTDATIEGATLLAACAIRRLEASDAILDGRVTAALRQEGCVRHSWVAPGSITPRRFRCPEGPGPSWRSRRYGDPALARLAPATPAAIRTGSELGDEPGAYAHLRETARAANLRAALADELRLGLEAGLWQAT